MREVFQTFLTCLRHRSELKLGWREWRGQGRTFPCKGKNTAYDWGRGLHESWTKSS